ncbi:2-C-methyl-D-erythritol 4-phosphate cytidylyltransferase [Paenibacillus barcinonensis]|uniref:2-C-methyl-D-erythritol 4-phosphate cytidylyltransferase n=1 Tax=Paenibacillus barcinonensis TaxID=198119 RepID=A0A2V4UTY5_PAEBA|nr:2-C-methyl-D-erythritol 4-phosphate cytidylyltransferase [Paenibacillus barcinonensis]PYE43657.1 2-C-methyl-D-erythritol 4-phosphate cytidylyltransferase [Paenibacillus barcinonensis]QKS57273.1 2-C-methyl-D-erythritol 4-phosphate cytidylyltransferase [Paenibacillus barcinonensis]
MDKGWGVVIVAAGRGTRMGTTESKQFLLLQGKPVFIHTLEVFAALDEIREMILVTGAADVERCLDWVKEYQLESRVRVIPGGKERQHSVHEGLRALGTDGVLVHDGVRPFVTREQIRDCMAAAASGEGAVLAVPVKDTIKQVNAEGFVTATPDRSSLWSIQTPQAFRLSSLLEAYNSAERDGFLGTDDAMLAERQGMSVKVVEGSYTNIKLTTPEDLQYAAFWLGGEKKR